MVGVRTREPPHFFSLNSEKMGIPRLPLTTHFSLDENMVEIHVDSLAGFEQSHLHVEFHQKVSEPWVGVESEHIA